MVKLIIQISIIVATKRHSHAPRNASKTNLLQMINKHYNI